MPVTITIPDRFFTSAERGKLKELFESDDDDQFNTHLQQVALAALSEYKSMLLGSGVPTRADEIKQHRLFYLIKHLFRNRLPSEAEVSAMFQLTQSQSRSLLRSVVTRFHYELDSELRHTLVATVRAARFNDDAAEYRVVIQSDNILEELNRIISLEAPNLPQIKKVRNMARTFSISEDAYVAIQQALGIQ